MGVEKYLCMLMRKKNNDLLNSYTKFLKININYFAICTNLEQLSF